MSQNSPRDVTLTPPLSSLARRGDRFGIVGSDKASVNLGCCLALSLEA